jgi:hypothetical protein
MTAISGEQPAQACVKHHGDDAATHASQRADELLERGDTAGAATWRRVLDAVKEHERMEPVGTVH